LNFELWLLFDCFYIVVFVGSLCSELFYALEVWVGLEGLMNIANLVDIFMSFWFRILVLALK
jgi:hypothetical protein